jgi:hypothetical protein
MDSPLMKLKISKKSNKLKTKNVKKYFRKGVTPPKNCEKKVKKQYIL